MIAIIPWGPGRVMTDSDGVLLMRGRADDHNSELTREDDNSNTSSHSAGTPQDEVRGPF